MTTARMANCAFCADERQAFIHEPVCRALIAGRRDADPAQQRQQENDRHAFTDTDECRPGNKRRKAPAKARHEIAKKQTVRVHFIALRLPGPPSGAE